MLEASKFSGWGWIPVDRSRERVGDIFLLLLPDQVFSIQLVPEECFPWNNAASAGN
jgi:hypothetical protein